MPSAESVCTSAVLPPSSLTHGFMTPTKRVSATSVFLESVPYHVDVSRLIPGSWCDTVCECIERRVIPLSLPSSQPNSCVDGECYLMANVSHAIGILAAV